MLSPILNKLELRYQSGETIYPAKEQLFAAFDYVSPESVKVVLLGQDPYHGPEQANGLCFSVSEGVDLPPSLKNIYKELQDDLGLEMPQTGDLSPWAKEGVLLLNSCLSVEKSNPGAHKDLGWQEFTDFVLARISEKTENVVFILWGGYARKKKKLIDTSKHYIIESAHPSPLSSYSGFFGSKPFSKTRDYLLKHKIAAPSFHL